MNRIASTSTALLCGLATAAACLVNVTPAQARSPRVLNGTVMNIEYGTFTIQSPGRRMGVINAMVRAAGAITRRDYPYVWGGGHARAGIASAGIPGPGHGHHRVGFDCSGAVAAVLADAGLWPAGASVGSDENVIAELRARQMIARGAGKAPNEVTLYDDPGIHIFMNINGRFFGTSDGDGGGNRRGGAGWLYDDHWDVRDRDYRRWHIRASVLRTQTTYGYPYTFQDEAVSDLLASLEAGDRVRVGYTTPGDGTLSARSLSWIGGVSVSGVVTAVSLDGSSMTLQTGSREITLRTLAGSTLLSGVKVGDTVTALYTSGRAARTIRTLEVTATPTAARASGTVSSIATDGAGFTIQTEDGSMTFITAPGSTLLSGVNAGDSVTVDYLQTSTGTLIAQAVDDQGTP